MRIARTTEKWIARIRWGLAHWPRRPEVDVDPATASRWKAFRRGGGITGRLHDAFRRRLSPSGKALCGLWFAALVVSRVPGRSLAYIPLALVSAALAVSWILSWRRPTLEAVWRLPEALALGHEGEIDVVLRNPGPRTVRDPGVWFFRVSDGLDLPGDGLHVPSLAAGASTLLRVPVVPRLRGPARLDPPHLLVLEPLGLMRSSRRSGGAGSLVVKPARPHLREFRFLVAGTSGPAFAAVLGNASTRQGDPSGVREFREGDSMRDLHHRSWARRGRPVTRERSADRGTGIRLVVSTALAHQRDRAQVDDLLALAASVARWLGERRVLGDAWIDGERVLDGDAPLEERFWEACGSVPRAGWGRWERCGAGPPDGDDAPVVELGRFAREPSPRTKRLVLDWMTETVEMDPSGSVLRVSPLLARGEALSL